jgi:hypothetical protein
MYELANNLRSNYRPAVSSMFHLLTLLEGTRPTGGCVDPKTRSRTGQSNISGRVLKLSTNFAETRLRVHGNFEEQNYVLESSVIIINY